jgi:hypothetical protein
MMTRNASAFRFRAATAIGTLLAIACGSSSSGPNTNLKSVFFRTVTAAPVATLTVQQKNGTAFPRARVRIDTRPTFDSWIQVGRRVTANANATSGVATVALTAGTYPILVDPQSAGVGTLNDTLAISADMNRTWQTSQQTWTVNSPKPFSAVTVTIYQLDAGGAALYGTTVNQLDPVVLTVSPTVPGGNASNITFTTELFKGSYRAVINATPVTPADNIALFETAAFSAAGGGALETQTAALTSGGNVIALKFMENGVAAADALIGGVVIFDAGSLIPLNLLNPGTSTGGVATVYTGSLTNVIAIVLAPTGETLSAASYTASPTHSATLTRYTVSGHVKPPGTTQLLTPFGFVEATLKPGLGAFWDAQLSGTAVTATISDALGTYQLKLFGGSWSLQAVGLKSLANSAAVSLNVSANVPTQDINVDAGGVITVNVQDQSRNNVPNVGVQVVAQDATHNVLGTNVTDANGNYSVSVPFGTYEVFADGALTRDVSVSSSAATKTVNLTRFQINGRLTDASLAPVAGTVSWGAGPNSATATALGTYTINVVQGLNWFLFQPPTSSPSLGFAYELNALVNADTVKSLL